MQAIRTKYLCTTEHRPSRMKATCSAGEVTVPYEHGLNGDGNHRVVCEALRAKLGWTRSEGYADMVGGAHGREMYWVFTSDMKTTDAAEAPRQGAVLGDHTSRGFLIS